MIEFWASGRKAYSHASLSLRIACSGRFTVAETAMLLGDVGDLGLRFEWSMLCCALGSGLRHYRDSCMQHPGLPCRVFALCFAVVPLVCSLSFSLSPSSLSLSLSLTQDRLA